jgi:hypothetical protein
MLAEMSCVMLHGQQREYFWNTNNEAARHYKQVCKQLQSWRRRDDRLFASVNKVLFYTYAQYVKDQFVDDLLGEEIVVREKLPATKKRKVDFVIDQKALRRSLGRKVLRKRTDGEEKKEI